MDAGPLSEKASKETGSPIGGIYLLNLYSGNLLGDGGRKCTECHIFRVRYNHVYTGGSLNAWGRILETILDAFPVPDGESWQRLEKYIEFGENAVSLATGLADLHQALSEANELMIRGVVCADGRRQIAVINVPKASISGPYWWGSPLYRQHFGAWIHSAPGGATDLWDAPFYLEEL